jgi:hypothetical protein
MAVAKGVAYWAGVLGEPKADKFDDALKWSLDLEVDDEERARLVGLGIKSKENNPNVFVFKRYLINKKTGNNNPPPNVVDAGKNPWDQESLIGNGSKVNVAFNTYPHPMDSKTGLGKGLQAVQVMEHVPYGVGSGLAEFNNEAEAVDEF